MTSVAPQEIERTISSLLTTNNGGQVQLINNYGSFNCDVKPFHGFKIIQRNYQSNINLNIPIRAERPCIQMMFSMNGQSVYRDKFNPFILSQSHHSLNYFNEFDCKNLIGDKSIQQDVIFTLGETFFKDIVEQSGYGFRPICEKVINREEINTINKHQPIDNGILALLKNILNCPFRDEFKSTYIQEHVRTLLIIQFYIFNQIVSDKKDQIDNKITAQDKEALFAIKAFLDEHPLENTSLLQLSRHFGINEFKLKYGFKKLFNVSPIKYLQNKRLELSLQLLRDTTVSVNQIAYEIGYNHSQNFIIAFRKKYGFAPLIYRKSKSISFKETPEATTI